MLESVAGTDVGFRRTRTHDYWRPQCQQSDRLGQFWTLRKYQSALILLYFRGADPVAEGRPSDHQGTPFLQQFAPAIRTFNLALDRMCP